MSGEGYHKNKCPRFTGRHVPVVDCMPICNLIRGKVLTRIIKKTDYANQNIMSAY
jgi:hypothetical protein